MRLLHQFLMKTGLLIIFQIAKEICCILEDLPLPSYFLQNIICTSWQSHHGNNCQIGTFKFLHCMNSLPMKSFCSQNNLIVKWFMGWDYNKCSEWNKDLLMLCKPEVHSDAQNKCWDKFWLMNSRSWQRCRSCQAAWTETMRGRNSNGNSKLPLIQLNL